MKACRSGDVGEGEGSFEVDTQTGDLLGWRISGALLRIDTVYGDAVNFEKR